MAKKKKQPFHIKHKLKQFELKDGTKFWAKDESDAKLYRKKVGEGNSTNFVKSSFAFSISFLSIIYLYPLNIFLFHLLI